MASQTLASLVVKVGADLGLFSSGLTRAEKQIKKFGDDVGRLGETLTKRIGLPAIGLVGYFVKVADEAGTLRDRLRAYFGDSSKAIEEVIAKTQQLGLNSVAATKAASNFLVFAKGLGLTKEKTVELFKEMAQLAAELQQFYDVAPEEVFLALQRAIAGNTRALKALGLAIAAGQKSAEDEDEAFEELGRQIESTSEITKRWEVVQKALSPVAGTTQRELQDISLNVRILKSEWEQLALAVGETFLPGALKIITHLREMVLAIKEQHLQLAQGILKWGLIAGAVGVFLKIGGLAITNIVTIVGAVRSLTTALIALAPHLTGVALSNLATASELAAGKVLGLSVALSGLAFLIGSELGKVIDEALGISDAIQKTFFQAKKPVDELAEAVAGSAERWDNAFFAYEKLRQSLGLSGPEWEVANERTRENAILLVENTQKASEMARKHLEAAASIRTAEELKAAALRSATEQVKNALDAHIKLARELEDKGIVLPVLVARGFDELKKVLKASAEAGASGAAIIKGLEDDVAKLREDLALYPNLPVPEWFKKLGAAIDSGASDSVLELAKHLDDVEPAAKKLSVKLVEVLGPDGEMHRALVQSFEDAGEVLEVSLGKRLVDAARSAADGVVKVFDELGQWARTHPLTVPAQVAWDDPRMKELFSRWLDELDRSWGR